MVGTGIGTKSTGMGKEGRGVGTEVRTEGVSYGSTHGREHEVHGVDTGVGREEKRGKNEKKKKR